MSIFAKPGVVSGDSLERVRRENISHKPRNGSDGSGEISIIGKGVRIEGDIHVTGDVRVGGRINGAVYVDSRIVVAPDGVIFGCIESGDCDIAGKVEGDVICRGRLVIRKSASILGQISAESLVVEDGAAISGTCKVGKPSRIDAEPQPTVGDGAPEGAAALLPLK